MKQDVQKQLMHECIKYRKAIENNKDKLEMWWFHKFPNGCCSDTSLMLGRYLDDKQYGKAYHVSGILGHNSHAWLELDGWIIDITADQFAEVDESIIVAKETYFHNRFEDVEKVIYSELFTGKNFGDIALLKAYGIIKQAIGDMLSS